MSRDNNFVDNLMGLTNRRLGQVNTQIPARVTNVNYQNNSLNALPLITTRDQDEQQVPYPELFDVPFMVLSGNSGSARITFPITVGDTVLIEFCQRDLQGFFQSDGRTVCRSYSGSPMGLYPVLAIPCLFTQRSAVPVNNSDVVIENNTTQILLDPNGLVTINADVVINGNTTMNGDLTVNGDFSAQSGSFTHEGVDVGSEHVHIGVTPGGGETGTPAP